MNGSMVGFTLWLLGFSQIFHPSKDCSSCFPPGFHPSKDFFARPGNRLLLYRLLGTKGNSEGWQKLHGWVLPILIWVMVGLPHFWANEQTFCFSPGRMHRCSWTTDCHQVPGLSAIYPHCSPLFTGSYALWVPTLSESDDFWKSSKSVIYELYFSQKYTENTTKYATKQKIAKLDKGNCAK